MGPVLVPHRLLPLRRAVSPFGVCVYPGLLHIQYP